MRSSSIWILLIFLYAVTALRCIVQDRKSQEEPEIHVIHLDDESKESPESDIVSLQVPDRRKREVWESRLKVACRSDDDCGPGEVCLAYLRCVQATKRVSQKKEEEPTGKL